MKQRVTQHGFTLIEVLVVIIIISIIATVAVIATGDFGRSKRLQRSVELFQSQCLYARQQALINGKIYALSTKHSEYQFYTYHISVKKPHWQLITKDPILKSHHLPAAAIFRVIKAKDKNYQLQFFPDGMLTPVTFQILDEENKAQFNIVGTANGELHVKKL